MSPTARTLAWVAVLGMLLGAALEGVFLSRTSHGSGVHGVASPSVVDSSAAVRVRDSLTAGWADSRRKLDSFQVWADTAPADTVWRVVRRLIRDTVDTGRVDTLRLVTALVVDDSACRMDRDSLAGEVTLWRARDAAHAEAYRIAQDRPVVVGDTSPPSRTTWAAVGAAGTLVGVTTILVLGR